MATPLPLPSRSTRPIGIADLEQVIAIDRINVGHIRRRFFEKRFAGAKARPDDFVHIGIVVEDKLCGFVIARILRGEFGQKDAVTVVDALGVVPERREHGLGQSLMEGLIETSRENGARCVQSQVNWKNDELLRFFSTSGFVLAPRLALERSMSVLGEESGEEP